MNTDFNFIDPDFDEIFAREKEKEISRVIYFGQGTQLEEAKGRIKGVIRNSINEEYLCFGAGEEIRVDRIITINGIPGPAYPEYDSYSLSCLSCMGGMD